MKKFKRVHIGKLFFKLTYSNYKKNYQRDNWNRQSVEASKYMYCKK